MCIKNVLLKLMSTPLGDDTMLFTVTMLTRQAKHEVVSLCCQIEQEEEHIANRLLKRLDQLKQEKQVCTLKRS